MTYRYNFYPRAIYQFLNNLAFENHLSIKEVEIILLRKQMEYLGFTCDHVTVKNAEKTGLMKKAQKLLNPTIISIAILLVFVLVTFGLNLIKLNF